MKVTKEERQAAIEKLRDMLTPGQTVYTVLNHVSASGMQRAISLAIPTIEGGRLKIMKLDYWASRALGLPFHKKHAGLTVGGCGMDMGFHLVYTLGQALWPEGTPQPHSTRNGAPDSAGGYALRHEWL